MAKFIKVKGWRSQKIVDVHINAEHIVIVHGEDDCTRIGLLLSEANHPHAEYSNYALYVEHTLDEVMALINS